MDEDKKEALQKMQENHLSLLTTYGVHFIGSVESVAEILYEELFGEETHLSQDEKKKGFEALMATVRKHRELIEWSIKERETFFSMQNDDQNQEDNYT